MYNDLINVISFPAGASHHLVRAFFITLVIHETMLKSKRLT